mmetsp:Transcript_19856/g.30588  ORF Transcript_19856/g.30588 Transcript_19856/m.30588 type:complete len:81 (-) Transcript_19856:764-1006(-)
MGPPVEEDDEDQSQAPTFNDDDDNSDEEALGAQKKIRIYDAKYKMPSMIKQEDRSGSLDDIDINEDEQAEVKRLFKNNRF